MRIDCGPSKPSRWTASHSWHLWFAWFPVRVGEHDCRWLETVERKNTYEYVISYKWEYRERANG